MLFLSEAETIPFYLHDDEVEVYSVLSELAEALILQKFSKHALCIFHVFKASPSFA